MMRTSDVSNEPSNDERSREAWAEPPWGVTRWGRPRRGPVSRRRRWRQSQAIRLVAVLLVGLAAWLTVRALAPAPVDLGVPTVVAVRELALGSRVEVDDVRLESRPAGQRPTGALDRVDLAVGQVVSGPVLPAEVITTARFRGSGQLAGLPPGTVAVSVPVDDPSLLLDVRPAMSVTVLAAGSGDPLANEARVLVADGPGTPGSDSGLLAAAGASSGRVVVAVSTAEARAIAAAMGPRGAAGGFVVAVRG